MKKTFISTFLLALCANGVMAQSYKLESMTAETFAKGGDSQWSFEWYSYADQAYSAFTQYGDSSYCNYLDWYNPERMGGKRITEIDGVAIESGNYTFYYAANKRNAWYNVTYRKNQAGTSYEQYCYVAKDPREGFGYELYGNKGRASVVTFTVPADGYYKVEGTVEREDNNTPGTIILMPRYRYASASDQNKATNYNTMTSAINYGTDNCGELEGWANASLGQGAEQRYLAQQPKDYSFYFQGKKGDKVSFEVNVTGMTYTDAPDAARAGWARTFLPKLDITVTDEATATADASYINPYGTAAAEELAAYIEELSEKLNSEEISGGTDVGQYPTDEINKMDNVLNEVQTSIDNGEVNDMNAAAYRAKVDAAWQRLMSSKNTTDWTAEGNYRLFHTSGTEVVADQDALDKNDGNPWNFQNHKVSDGTYANFTTHDKNGNYTSSNTWYNSKNWVFIADDGNLHPGTADAPSYVFTAPNDAVYHVQYSFHREDFNSKVSKSLFMRARFMPKGTTTCNVKDYIFAQEYGLSEATMKDVKTMNFYVNMKAGDKLTLEADAYTNNQMASARSKIDNLSISSRNGKSDALFTASDVPSDAQFYNAYKLGDKTELKAVTDSANTWLDKTASNIGTGEGQYDADTYNALKSEVANANAILSSSSATQVDCDNEVKALKTAIQNFLDGRHPFEFKPRGNHGIRIAGTNQHLTRKNESSVNSHYAAWLDEAGAKADATKNKADMKQYAWIFKFSEWDHSTLSDEDINQDAIGSTVVTATDIEGYLQYGHIQLGELNPATTTYNLRFYKKESSDSTFCVKTMDGKYWEGRTNWVSPNDIMSTVDKPQYIFVLDDTPLDGTNDKAALTGIRLIEDGNNGQPKYVYYYTLDGRRTIATQKGLLIRQTVMTNGKTKTEKVIVK